MELGVLQRRPLREIDEIDTGNVRPAFPAHSFQERAGAAANIEHRRSRARLRVTRDDSKLLAIE